MNNSFLREYSLCNADDQHQVLANNTNNNSQMLRNLSLNDKANNHPLNSPYFTSDLMNSEFFFNDTNDEIVNSKYTIMNDLESIDDSSKQDEIEIFDREVIDQNNKLSSKQIDNKQQQTPPIATNLIEIESVKNKLSSIWNNVKYGWSSYIKKPAKISLDKTGPIFILGKKYNPNNPYERPTLSNTFKLADESSNHYDLIDKFESLNESFINPSIPIQRPQQYIYDEETGSLPVKLRPVYSINNNDYLSSSSSASLSTSPYYLTNKLKTDPAFYLIDDKKLKNNNSNKKTALDYYLQPQNDSELKTHLEKELHSRLWFTYRKDFQPLNGNLKYTSDCGWGCMLRSAQMLIAQAFLLHFFGKDWSLYKKFKVNEYNLYKEIISWFNDRPSKYCPFGLHRLLEIADQKSIGNPNTNETNGSRVGSWFGPNSVCLLMKEALAEAVHTNHLLDQIKMYVAQDCTIYKQDVIDLCTNLITNEFKPCIILVSVRLGGEDLNDIYVSALKKFLEMDICIGIIGGKPKHSLYFMGYQSDKVIYLDPHFVQPTTNIYSSNDPSFIANTTNVSPESSLSSSKHSYDDNISSSDYEIFENSTYHCENPSKIPFNKLDPSLAIGFYCATLLDLNNLCEFVKKTPSFDNIFPVFGVCDDSFNKIQLNYQMCSLDENSKSPKDACSKTQLSRKSPVSDNCLSTSPGASAGTSSTTPNKTPRSHTTERKAKSSFLSERLTSKLGKQSTTKSKSSSLTSNNNNSKTKRKPSCNDSDDFVLV